jgi:hypothetical protein
LKVGAGFLAIAITSVIVGAFVTAAANLFRYIVGRVNLMSR